MCLLWTYGLSHRPCNRQLTQLEGNLSNLIDAAFGSLRDLLCRIHSNWLRLTWCLRGSWPLESTRHHLCYFYHQFGVLPKPSCFFNLSPSIPHGFSLLRVAIHFGRLASGIRMKSSVTVNFNSIDISRHFTDAISAHKSVWYLARRLSRRDASKRCDSRNPVCETYLKLKSDNSVKAYARVWPGRKVYQ